MENYRLTAKTFSGLEEVLSEEIRKIGGKNVQTGRRVVTYTGNAEILYKSNYLLRTALRILKEIEVFEFKNTDHFYLKCKSVDWINVFRTNQTFSISSTVVNSPDFNNSMFVSLKVKDAIADYFREKTGRRPDVNTEDPDIYINVHIQQNKCTLSLDSSGESLHKRGYRLIQGEAPLNEVLAAGMILITGWNGTTDLIDPMCGSGTIPVEAALMAANIPPGKFRKSFAFMNWPDYDEELFGKITSAVSLTEPACRIFASDISAGNLLNAQTNARRALVYKRINFQTSDFRNLKLDVHDATLIINPPYGERITVKNTNELYAMIGERLKHQFAGNKAWILSSARESMNQIGLKPNKRFKLFNGSLECQYNNYNLFSGKLYRNDNNKEKGNY